MSVAYDFILSCRNDKKGGEAFQDLITNYHKFNAEPFWFCFDLWNPDIGILVGQFGKGDSFEIFIQAMRAVTWRNTDAVQLWIYSDHSGCMKFEEVDWECLKFENRFDFS